MLSFLLVVVLMILPTTQIFSSFSSFRNCNIYTSKLSLKISSVGLTLSSLVRLLPIGLGYSGRITVCLLSQFRKLTKPKWKIRPKLVYWWPLVSKDIFVSINNVKMDMFITTRNSLVVFPVQLYLFAFLPLRRDIHVHDFKSLVRCWHHFLNTLIKQYAYNVII